MFKLEQELEWEGEKYNAAIKRNSSLLEEIERLATDEKRKKVELEECLKSLEEIRRNLETCHGEKQDLQLVQSSLTEQVAKLMEQFSVQNPKSN